LEWKAALYGRVSTDHEEQQESIKIQREALMQYAIANNMEIEGYYFDEGCTGTNFDRPELGRLKRDIEGMKINLVIVKDLSRVGRNNSLTLSFLDYLCDNSIRLIAINDNYDTSKDEDDLIGIKTWVNERYSKELSEKIKFALNHKKRKGEYLCAFSPFGYKKSAEVRNKLEVDDFASTIVKKIFDMYINGYGFVKISNILQQKGVLNPSQYGVYGRKSSRWDWTTIKRIITNPVYTGHSVQQKYYKKSFKNSIICKSKESDWVIVKNTHEDIISEEVFNLAQQILDKRGKSISYRCGGKNPHKFTSFIFCHECGSPLYYKNDKNAKGVYRCGQYTKYGRKYCSSHYISELDLENIVLQELINIINNLTDMSALEKILKMQCTQDNNHVEELCGIESQICKYKKKIELAYKDRLNGIIHEDLFLKTSNELNSFLKCLDNEKNIIISGMSQSEDKKKDESVNIGDIPLILGFNKGIRREMLERFIKRIEIYENGDILIDFNFFVS